MKPDMHRLITVGKRYGSLRQQTRNKSGNQGGISVQKSTIMREKGCSEGGDASSTLGYTFLLRNRPLLRLYKIS